MIDTVCGVLQSVSTQKTLKHWLQGPTLPCSINSVIVDRTEGESERNECGHHEFGILIPYKTGSLFKMLNPPCGYWCSRLGEECTAGCGCHIRKWKKKMIACIGIYHFNDLNSTSSLLDVKTYYYYALTTAISWCLGVFHGVKVWWQCNNMLVYRE